MSIVLLFKNSMAGMQFLLSSHRFRRLLNSTTAVPYCHHASTLTPSLGCLGPQRVFAFPQDVVSQASKAYPEMSNYRHVVCHPLNTAQRYISPVCFGKGDISVKEFLPATP